MIKKIVVPLQRVKKFRGEWSEERGERIVNCAGYLPSNARANLTPLSTLLTLPSKK